MCQTMGMTVALGLLLLFCVTAQPLTNVTAGTPECSSNTDCSSGKACVEENCADPCDGVCGSNTACHLVNLAPMCVCKPGYTGHAFTGCTADPKAECTTDSQCSSDKACVQFSCVDPCQSACGVNTECKVINHRFMCACKKDFDYDHSIGCIPRVVPECKTNAQCTAERACVGQRCVDPCVGVCGNNTVCRVTNHFPACACSPGFTGNAFEECKPLCLPLNTTSRTFKTGLKKKFVLSDKNMTWAEASGHCLSKDMDLAAIENEQEQAEVNMLIGHIEDECVYTSGWSYDGYLPNFVWLTTGNPLEYSNWQDERSVMKTTSEYQCLVITPSAYFYSSSYWAANKCTDQRRFICQYYQD